MKRLVYHSKWIKYEYLSLGEGYMAEVVYRLPGELKLRIRRRFIRKEPDFYTHLYFGTRGEGRKEQFLLCSNCKEPYRLLQLARDHNFYCRKCMGQPNKVPVKLDSMGKGRLEYRYLQQASAFFKRAIPIFELRALESLPLLDFFRDRGYLIPPEWATVHEMNPELYVKLLGQLRTAYRKTLRTWVRDHRPPNRKERYLFFQKLDARLRKRLAIHTEEPILCSTESSKRSRISSATKGRQADMRLQASPFEPGQTELSSSKTSSSPGMNVKRAEELVTSNVPPVAGQETRHESLTHAALSATGRSE